MQIIKTENFFPPSHIPDVLQPVWGVKDSSGVLLYNVDRMSAVIFIQQNA